MPEHKPTTSTAHPARVYRNQGKFSRNQKLRYKPLPQLSACREEPSSSLRRTSFADRPVAPWMAFCRTMSPMPSSIPSYAGANCTDHVVSRIVASFRVIIIIVASLSRSSPKSRRWSPAGQGRSRGIRAVYPRVVRFFGTCFVMLTQNHVARCNAGAVPPRSTGNVQVYTHVLSESLRRYAERYPICL